MYPEELSSAVTDLNDEQRVLEKIWQTKKKNQKKEFLGKIQNEIESHWVKHSNKIQMIYVNRHSQSRNLDVSVLHS